jgi:topoisomerase IA-like protein
MSINPDAHSTREIDLTHWGVEMARKGGVPKERVLNCLNKEEFAEYLANRCDQRRGKRLAPGRRIPQTRKVRAKAAKKASPAAHKKRSVAS